MRIRRLRALSIASVFAFGSVLALAGCKGCGKDDSGGGASPSATAATSAPSADASASAHARRAPFVRLAGVGGQLFRATQQLELREDQKAALEKISADLNEARQQDGGNTSRIEMREANEDLVAGIKAGKVDVAKCNAHGPLLEKAAASARDKDDEALKRLHEILDAGQRATVVGNVRKQEEKREARMKAHEKPDAATVNFARQRMESFTRDLGLDAEQQKKIEAAYPAADSKAVSDVREEAKKELDALLTAFEKDTFDPKAAIGDVHKAKRAFEELVAFMAKITPVLKPEQREKLAKKLEHQGERPGGFGGPGRPRRPFGPGAGGADDDGEP